MQDEWAKESRRWEVGQGWELRVVVMGTGVVCRERVSVYVLHETDVRLSLAEFRRGLDTPPGNIL